MNEMSIGQRIHEKRLREGLSQTELAVLIGVGSACTISRWERGHRKPNPRYLHYPRLMRWLGEGVT